VSVVSSFAGRFGSVICNVAGRFGSVVYTFAGRVARNLQVCEDFATKREVFWGQKFALTEFLIQL